MGRNVFVSYKYKDENVPPKLLKTILGEPTIVRDYVNELQTVLDKEDHINLGEKDNESLQDFSDGYIESSLKKKIYRSSITIVMISKGMVTSNLVEKDQWIPWEIAYSLRVVKREDSTSKMNAVLGIVLPDKNNSYDWLLTKNVGCNCTTYHTNKLFSILSSNMFNMKDPVETECEGLKIHHGEFSFIKTVQWDVFKENCNHYLDKAIEIRDNKELYNININV